MQHSEWGTLGLSDIGQEITLDSRRSGNSNARHAVVKGTLVGVSYYFDEETEQKRSRLEVRTFGQHVTVIELVDGDLAQPVTDEPGAPNIF